MDPIPAPSWPPPRPIPVKKHKAGQNYPIPKSGVVHFFSRYASWLPSLFLLIKILQKSGNSTTNIIGLTHSYLPIWTNSQQLYFLMPRKARAGGHRCTDVSNFIQSKDLKFPRIGLLRHNYEVRNEDRSTGIPLCHTIHPHWYLHCEELRTSWSIRSDKAPARLAIFQPWKIQ